MNLQRLTKQVCNIACAAGDFIHAESGKVKTTDIEEKYLNNLVSYVDVEAEKMIVAALQNLLPEAGFIAEEGTVEKKEAAFQWVIDPLDGTTNFLYQIPSYAVSIALMKDDELIIGVVYEITRKECFYAWKDGGAYLNGDPIKVRNNPNLKEALMATGFPYYDYSLAEPYFKILQSLVKQTRGIRRLGAAAVDLCFVACGRFDGFYEHSLSPWDVAAGSLIVQEAGGKVCDFKGGDEYVFGREIVASSEQIHGAFMGVVKNELGHETPKTKNQKPK